MKLYAISYTYWLVTLLLWSANPLCQFFGGDISVLLFSLSYIFIQNIFYSIMIIMCFSIGYVDDMFCIKIEDICWLSPQYPYSSHPHCPLMFVRGSKWFQKSWLHPQLLLGYRPWTSQSALAVPYDWCKVSSHTSGAINTDTCKYWYPLFLCKQEHCST